MQNSDLTIQHAALAACAGVAAYTAIAAAINSIFPLPAGVGVAAFWWGTATHHSAAMLSWWGQATGLQIAGLLARIVIPIAPALWSGWSTWTWFSGATDNIRDQGKKIVSGAHVLSGSAAIRAAQKAAVRDGAAGIKIHPEITLPRALERQGILALGAQRTGKTQALAPVVAQALARGDRVMLLDVKDDWSTTIDKSEILAPWDSRSVKWDIAADCQTELDAELFAATVIPERSGDGAVWSNATRVLLAGLIIVLQRTRRAEWGWRELADLAERERTEQIELLSQHYPVGLKIVREKSKTTDSVEFNQAAEFSWLRHAARAWPDSSGGFSIRNWVQNPDHETRALIVCAREDMGPLSDAVVVSAFELAIRYALALRDDSERRIWFVFDELAQVQKIPHIASIAAKGSSKGLCAIIGTQDFDLLVQKYGRDQIHALAGMLKTRIILGHEPGGHGAKFASSLLGQREVERMTQSQTSGASKGQSSWFFSPAPQVTKSIQHLTDDPAVPESEITSLPAASLERGAHGWLRVGGWNMVMRLTWPVRPISSIRESMTPANWLTGSEVEYVEQSAATQPAAVDHTYIIETTSETPARGAPGVAEGSVTEVLQHKSDPFLDSKPEPESLAEKPLDAIATDAAAEALAAAVAPGGAEIIHAALEILEIAADAGPAGPPAPAPTVQPGQPRKFRRRAEIESELEAE